MLVIGKEMKKKRCVHIFHLEDIICNNNDGKENLIFDYQIKWNILSVINKNFMEKKFLSFHLCNSICLYIYIYVSNLLYYSPLCISFFFSCLYIYIFFLCNDKKLIIDSTTIIININQPITPTSF